MNIPNFGDAWQDAFQYKLKGDIQGCIPIVVMAHRSRNTCHYCRNLSSVSAQAFCDQNQLRAFDEGRVAAACDPSDDGCAGL